MPGSIWGDSAESLQELSKAEYRTRLSCIFIQKTVVVRKEADVRSAPSGKSTFMEECHVY